MFAGVVLSIGRVPRIFRKAFTHNRLLVGEIEKAGTRADYGRLWDCIRGFLEPETNGRYPDPALQINLDLSHVSYIATANNLDPLPSPLRDRFRVIAFPKPTGEDLDALLPVVIADLAKEHGLHSRWTHRSTPSSAAPQLPTGSVRRLRRVVEAIGAENVAASTSLRRLANRRKGLVRGHSGIRVLLNPTE